MATFKPGQRVKVVSHAPDCPDDGDFLGIEGGFVEYCASIAGRLGVDPDGGACINGGADCKVDFDFYGLCYVGSFMLAPVQYDGNQKVAFDECYWQPPEKTKELA